MRNPTAYILTADNGFRQVHASISGAKDWLKAHHALFPNLELRCTYYHGGQSIALHFTDAGDGSPRDGGTYRLDEVPCLA